MRIGIMGVGMVGGTLARYFSEVKNLRRGEGLFLYDADPKKGFTDDVNSADVIFICVPTPPGKNGGADLSILESALASLQGEKTVVIKSTVPPGTTERYQKKFSHLSLLFSPEFLTESRAWEDMLRPDRQIVGHTEHSKNQAGPILTMLPQAFFSSPGTLGTYQFVRANATEAELGKYAGNLFGAIKVAYANILADIAEALGNTDYENVRKIVAHDRRIGDGWMDVYHNKYRGFAGICLPKDAAALMVAMKELSKKKPASAKENILLKKGAGVIKAVLDYNDALLASQRLSLEDVGVHDQEWLKRRRGAAKIQKNKTKKA